MYKLFISTPCYDAMVSMQYTISLLNLSNLLNKNNIEFVIDFIGNESLIPRARNKSLNNFIKSNFTHILFIDADLEFSAEAVLDLLKFNKDVVSCVYPKKGINFQKLIYSIMNDKSNESLDSRGLDFAYNILHDKNNKIIKNKDFIKARHTSTGFMMIKREIINKLCNNNKDLLIKSDELSKKDEEYYGLFCCMIKNKQYLSEDYSFCERVHEVNGEVWINIKHNLTHYGKYGFKSDIKNRSSYNRSLNEKIFYN